jgi:hypothetical protein
LLSACFLFWWLWASHPGSTLVTGSVDIHLRTPPFIITKTDAGNNFIADRCGANFFVAAIHRFNNPQLEIQTKYRPEFSTENQKTEYRFFHR